MKTGKSRINLFPLLIPFLDKRDGAFSFLCRSIRLGGKQTAAIDASVREAINQMISCRAWGEDTKILDPSRSPFPDISSYLRTFPPRFRTLSGDVRNYSIIRAVPSCLPLSRAVCLKKIAPPIG